MLTKALTVQENACEGTENDAQEISFTCKAAIMASRTFQMNGVNLPCYVQFTVCMQLTFP